MKLLLRIILTLLIVIVLTLGYFGFIPGLSDLLASNKPKDLNVKYSTSDISAAQAKSQVAIKEVDSLPASSPLVFEGKQEVTNSFSSTELTALIAGARWQYFPVSNVQVRANTDGTAEISGNLNVSILPSYFSSFRVSSEDVNKAISYLKIKGKPAFYLKGTVSVTNNRVALNPTAAIIGRLPIPQNLIATGVPYLARVAETRINSIPNLFIRSFSVDNGSFGFNGTVPTSVSRVKQ
ncbi:MAG: hypothetical protein WCT01_01185 [Candidatus Shapirobacteria bacterium]|jgi:hypothetical protein